MKRQRKFLAFEWGPKVQFPVLHVAEMPSRLMVDLERSSRIADCIDNVGEESSSHADVHCQYNAQSQLYMRHSKLWKDRTMCRVRDLQLPFPRKDPVADLLMLALQNFLNQHLSIVLAPGIS